MARKILLVAMVIVLLCIPEFVFRSHKVWPESYRHGKAIHESSRFVQACWIYREHTPGQKFPAKLSEVLPLMELRDDKSDDPWGNPYKYALVPNEKGELEPYVWAETIVDGKLKLHGAKCKSDGTVIRFGFPDRR